MQATPATSITKHTATLTTCSPKPCSASDNSISPTLNSP